MGLFYLNIGDVAHASTYRMDGDLIGAIATYQIQEDDNLYDIARRYDLGIVELLIANPGVDPWSPDSGQQLIIPAMHILPNTDHKGIVINLSELRLFYFLDDKSVMTFPVGIGREGWETPIGSTTVVGKRAHPAWIPPASIRVENPDLPEIVPPGLDNPLGEYAIELGITGYRIHGTNRPYGVGKRVSHGCIRLYPEDIARLFPLVKKGTPVTIIDTNYKIGQRNNELWFEVTPTQKAVDLVADYEQSMPIDISDIHKTIEQMAKHSAKINWYAVDEAIKDRNGIPVVIVQGLKN